MQPDFKLHTQHLCANAVLAFLRLFPHAEQYAKAMVQRTAHLFFRLSVRLMERMPAFGMTDHHKTRPRLRKHQRRNLPGVLSLFLPTHILRSQKDLGTHAVELPPRWIQGGIRRDHKPLRNTVRKVARAFLQAAQVLHSLGGRLIHLCVGPKINAVFQPEAPPSKLCHGGPDQRSITSLTP